ncbi:MAG: PolC-type DNA polymerase III [Lachnospiraceae bacterium]|nr:PolC-type DNA polymerase III [Lachnospiraceae bacterium]
MTGKQVKDVFPGLRFSNDINDLIGQSEVTGITMFEKDKKMVISILSNNLIPKKMIYKAENEISDFVFANKQVICIIDEHFNLSSQYKLRQLTDEYKESFLLEIKNESYVSYRLLSRGEWYCNDDNVLTLALENTGLARNHSRAIKEYLEHTYKDRFGMDIKVGFDYTEEQKTSLRAANELRLKYELKNIEELNESKRPKAKTQEAKESTGEAGVNEGESKPKTNKDNSSVPSENKQKSDSKVKDNQTAKGNYDKFSKGKYGKKSDGNYDENVIYGRNCEGDVISISELYDGVGVTCIKGQIITLEDRELKSGKFIINGTITDFTDTISFKVFVSPDDRGPLLEELKLNGFYIIKGVPQYDTYAKELTVSSISGIKPINDFREKRVDTYPEKRVELHLHTVMSEMDSVVDIEKVIKRAKEWGHKAIAITDHGCVQAFPIANHCVKPDEDFKIIYGVEGYFVDDLKDLVLNDKGQKIDSEYVVFDIETTGLSPKHNKIIEIGAVRIKDGKICDTYNRFVNPEVAIPYHITKLTSINDGMVKEAPTIETILPEFLDYVGDAIMVAHNASFDTGFIKEFAKRQGLPFDYTIVDTMTLAHVLIPELGKYTLDRLCKQFGVSLENHHRACDDAYATAEIYVKMLDMVHKKGAETISELNMIGSASADKIKKAKTYHGIILVKNEIGRVNLYRLISESHINYFNRRPRMPKSLINKYREGLIIGSACEAGELYQAVLNDASEDEITRLCDFYDYYEIQPNGNNMFMLKKDSISNVNSVEDLEEINRKIVELGRQFNKPVVATCDVHFLDPEDEVYRRIILAGQGFDDADDQPPLYYRTTEEMLKEFDYLGSDVAKEIVITNTNKIADMIEKISPVRPDKCPPIIENSDETLTKICYDKAHEIYGPKLPDIVKKRLDKELNSIISNGFAVMYIIAQKLVWKSNEDGYLVGSRGSVGSSFVATMAGITEVNPLPAHYICPHCYFVDFDSDAVKQYEGQSGCDMPDMNCPKCGTLMKKEGHDIPFETFLGFKGDKEPDIDLNFSGEYQAKAHAYTEELFGKGKAFKAGTIGTLADKTAYGYVYKYFEERHQEKRRCEMERLALGCTGVKRTTGQHPGGMIVLPRHEEIYSFTPIQKPANDMTTDVVTTHFEYHSIDHNLLKLDILGHDDPTMIRRLEDLTGVDAKKIALDDKDVMSLFHSTEVLGIEPSDIGGTKLGTLGVPEFGTEFAMQMLIDTHPKAFSDLVRIAGLSHGTDVWLGNAQTLIQEGTCELSSAICTRDDIMVYLMYRGLESGLAFNIMEKVRKGIVAKGKCEQWPEWKEEMKAHDVPDWYIWSCEKIKYMFPKAHAVAYVMMAWRIAWFKVNYPLEYYTAFFSIRASAFDYKLMCQGKAALEANMAELQKTEKDKMTATVKDTIKDMKIVQEMYARGIEFMPIDIYRAKADRFQIIDGKIMPSFNSIPGMGDKAAIMLEEAAKGEPFTSKEDLRIRAKVSKTILDDMEALGLLNGLPETNQYDFFSMLT